MKKYEDIISLPHHVSDHHPQMSIHDRAAQFSPFAALTGYGDAVEETARLTSQKKILDETEREALDRQLASLAGLLEESRKADGRRGRVPGVRITYFLPDQKKSGGAYLKQCGAVTDLDCCGGRSLWRMERGSRRRMWWSWSCPGLDFFPVRWYDDHAP